MKTNHLFENVRSFIDANNDMSLTDLAVETGISRRTLSRLAGWGEQGYYYQPTPEVLQKFASSIGTTTADLVATKLSF